MLFCMSVNFIKKTVYSLFIFKTTVSIAVSNLKIFVLESDS